MDLLAALRSTFLSLLYACLPVANIDPVLTRVIHGGIRHTLIQREAQRGFRLALIGSFEVLGQALLAMHLCLPSYVIQLILLPGGHILAEVRDIFLACCLHFRRW